MSIEANISAYLSGKMSLEEREAFEAKLKTNPDLLRELDNRKSMDLVFDHLLEEDLRAHLMQHNSKTNEAIGKAGWQKYIWLLVLLLGGLLIGTYFLLNHKSKKVSGDKIFAEYYKIPLNKDAVRSGAKEGISIYDQAKVDFYLGELESSKKLIQQVLPSLSELDSIKTLQNLLGHIAFQNKDYSQAINSWEDLNTKEAIYDKALAYYLLDSISLSKVLLRSVDSEDAQRLLQELD